MDTFIETFRAMGTDVEVTVVGADATLLTVASRRVAELEQRWSRFIASSEVSRLNRAAGTSTRVSSETTKVTLPPLDHVNPGRIEIDPTTQTVTLPAGSRFDPGGIGKGFAADLVAEELSRLGAAGVCVNLGGDVRVSGCAPRGDAWLVAVRDRDEDEPVGHVSIAEGAVATSSRSRRRWIGPDGREHHHIVDPATGASARTPVVHATAIASEGWRAEILATVAFLDRAEGIALAERCGATAMVATADGMVCGAGWARFARAVEVSA